ncbi:MAG: hypothetical protein PHI97_08970 [Desulfobulbus sp.]|nr:hypothetical protein [Desulfobulbus sp.]
MEKWLTAGEIIQLDFANKPTLISAVRSGQLTAYDHDEEPVNWHFLENQFKEIQDYLSIIQQDRINIKKDSPVAPWGILHRFFKNWARIKQEFPDDQNFNHDTRRNLALSQFLEIEAGWNSERIFEIISKSIFKTNDIEKILPKRPVLQPDTGNTHSSIKLPPSEPERIKLTTWKDIEMAAKRSKKTIEKAESVVKMPHVIHHEGHRVWAYEDELLDLITKYGKYSERKAGEKKAAKRLK